MSASRPAYFDYHATTPLDPRVLERMMPFLTDAFGNASSKHHSYGWFASDSVELAREQVADLLGATAREIVFTSGATESNNLAILGAARARGTGHVITQATEHKAVLDVVQALESEGFAVTVLPVDASGRVSANAVEGAIREDTFLVSVMHANNEVGTVHDLASIGQVCRAHGVWLHSDAAQTAGKLPIDLSSWPVDLLSLSAHKFYGPKGVGALFVRRRAPRVTLAPSFFGGGHERGLRSGTLNVPAIVGLGAAAALAFEEMGEESARVQALRDTLEARLLERVPTARVFGPKDRLHNNLNMWFPGVAADALLGRARAVAASSGSACSSTSLEPSHVLKAMGFGADEIQGAVRLSLGRFSEATDVDRAVESLVRAYEDLLSQSTGNRVD
ncbi:MAG: cysteine desulfurase family protein [Myxococcota bacterium]